jgi:hypothetical protein
MNRRTLIRRLGATGLATTAFAGTASASRGVRYGIDREIDVSDVSGTVTLDELLEPEEVRRLPADVDPRQREIIVSDDAGGITLGDCCVYCCSGDEDLVCDCSCCECDYQCA